MDGENRDGGRPRENPCGLGVPDRIKRCIGKTWAGLQMTETEFC